MKPKTGASTRRTDIQALRAVAVAFVVLEHISGWPAGGFIGVDVFFVVSGYLISSLLIREWGRSGRISMRDFYARRVRRLLPAATVTILATLVATIALFPRPRFVEVLIDSGWSAAFLANWHFGARGTDYFAQDGPVSPFQHFWSLAVEEQFYVVWPLMLIGVLALFARRGVTRTSRTAIAIILLVVVGGSFAIALAESTSNPTIAYFSTVDRAWELGVGALLAVASPLWSRLHRVVGELMAWVGFTTIFVGAAVIDSDSVFPAPWALVPVLGTALVLVGGSPERAMAPYPLRNRAVQYLGDISYSLYLWHFPIFVITAYVAPGALWFAGLCSVGAAVVSYHGIEQPFLRVPSGGRHAWRTWRDEHRPTFRVCGIASLAVVVTACVGLASVHTEARVVPSAIQEQVAAAARGPEAGAATTTDAAHGPVVTALQNDVAEALQATSWPDLSPPVEAYLGADKPGSPTNNCANLKNLLPQSRCTFGPETASRTIVLIGDSVAAYERPALESIVEASGGSVRLINRAAWACVFADVEISTACTAYREETIALVNDVKPDLVVLTNTYDQVSESGSELTVPETRERVARYLDRIEGSVGKFAFVTPPPRGKVLSECYREGGAPSDCIAPTPDVWRTVHAMYTDIAEDHDAAVIDTRPLLCAADSCPAFIGDHVVRQDPTHLAYDFAKTLGPAFVELFEAEGVSLVER